LPDRSIAGPLHCRTAPAPERSSAPSSKAGSHFRGRDRSVYADPPIAENGRGKPAGKAVGENRRSCPDYPLPGNDGETHRSPSQRRGFGVPAAIQQIMGMVTSLSSPDFPKDTDQNGTLSRFEKQFVKKRSASGGPLLDAINKREPRNLDEGHTNNPAYNVQYRTSLRSGKV